MQPYDINRFIESVKDKDYYVILDEAQKAVYAAERGTSGVKGAVRKREAGALGYAADLKGLIFFLGNGVKPAGVNDYVFQSFKPIVQSLVDRKQFKPEALDVFK